MAETRRIPFVLNLDDPTDYAIWERLEPMLQRHRASQFIRGAVARELGLTSSGAAMPPAALPTSTEHIARRPVQLALPEPAQDDTPDDQEALDKAADNFLGAFG